MLRRFGWYIAMAAVFSAAAVPVVVGNRYLPTYSSDEIYHLEAIQQFHDQWPHASLYDYPSPETPLYYLVLAAFSLLSDKVIFLRLISVTLSLLGLLAIQAIFMTKARAPIAFLYTACLAVSPYFFGAAVRIRTENPALCTAIVALCCFDFASEWQPIRAVMGAFLATLAVLMRQVYVWLAPTQLAASIFDRRLPRSARIFNSLLSALPLMALLPFFAIWHGFTTPFAQSQIHVLAGPETVISLLSLLGIFGTVFIATFARAWSARMCRPMQSLPFAVAGLIVLGVHSVNLEPNPQLLGGWLFDFARMTPSIAGNSLAFWLLCPAGLVYFYVILAEKNSPRSNPLKAAFIFWILANAFASRNYQRYYEPMLIFFVGYALSPLGFERWFEWVLPIAYVGGYVAVDAVRFYGL